MKKLIAIGVAFATILSSAEAGLIVSNVVAGTQVVYAGRMKAYEIVAYGATANIIGVYDSLYSSNALTIPAYTRSTNITLSTTNVTTNGVFIYDTATQTLLQTNIFVNGNWRTNISVSAAVVGIPVSATVPVVAGSLTDVPNLDLIFLRGITITATNDATVIIYTRD